MQDFFISMIKKNIHDSQTYLFHLGYDNQENIFNEISNTSLFDSRKTIIIKNINKFSVKAKNELIELINKNDHNHCIIFVKNNYDNKNKFIESLIKHSTSIDVRTPFESKMYEWVKFFLNQENIKIEINEIPKYIEHFGSNISNVMNYIKIDSLSKIGNPKKYTFPIPKVNGLDISYSGLKTSFINFISRNNEETPNFISNNLNDICSSIQYNLIKNITNKIELAVKRTSIKSIAVGGGVSANTSLRNFLIEKKKKENWKIYIPPIPFTTDNAAMIAIAGYIKYKRKNFSNCMDINICSNFWNSNYGFWK